jgi:hypothetical protein
MLFAETGRPLCCHRNVRRLHRSPGCVRRTARRDGALRLGERGTSLPGKDHELSGPAMQPSLLYPENITLGNLSYFVAVPTLCYQMEYPRSDCIRGWWLAQRVVELMLVGGLMMVLVDQYVEPAVLNTLVPMHQSNFLQITEHLLRLSLPCLYVWLLMFYSVRCRT